MNSELSITRGYSKFWEELLIIDSRNYISFLNECLAEEIFKPLEIEDIRQRHDLINEIAFTLFSMYCDGKMELAAIQKMPLNDPLLKGLFKEILKKFRFRLPGKDFEHEIVANELMIIKELSQRLIQSFSNRECLIVSPAFNGCGIVEQAKGDIYYKNTLVEVKAGDENFGIRHIRQLLIYGALNSIQEEPLEIKYVRLFNPRRGISWEESIDTLIEDIAGCTSFEFFNQLIDFISSEYRSL